jgi:ABC-type branched-subunit amino acid transport system ATPase component
MVPKHPDTILRVDNLHKSFDGQVVLNGVSLSLRKGEVILLRGDNGSGKTTLLNILGAHLVPDFGTIHFQLNGAKETFHFPQTVIQKLNPFNHFNPEHIARSGLCRTWQELRLFSTLDLLDNISVASTRPYGESPIAALLQRARTLARDRAILAYSASILTRLGLDGRGQSSADMVSLGQSKKVAIARAIQTGAAVLFLDEPFAGLDKDGVVEVMGLLKSLICETPITLVIIEHISNFSEVLSFATRVWTLSDGKLQSDSPEQLKKELKTTNREKKGYLQRLAGPRGSVELEELPRGAWLSRIIPAGTENNPPGLEIRDLVVRYGKRVIIGDQSDSGTLKGLSFTIKHGQTLVLSAPNGWGKTTLLRTIAGLDSAVKGSIQWNGIEIGSLSPWKRAKDFLSLFQAQGVLFPGLTVDDTLRLSSVTKVPSNIRHMLNRRVDDLSGGERRIVSMICALFTNKPIVLLDEPFSSIDEKRHKQLEDMLLHRSGVTLIGEPGSI